MSTVNVYQAWEAGSQLTASPLSDNTPAPDHVFCLSPSQFYKNQSFQEQGKKGLPLPQLPTGTWLHTTLQVRQL